MNTITDDQIAEIERNAGFKNGEGFYLAHNIPCVDLLGLITRLREAELDAARYRWIREVASGAPEDFEVVACAAFAAAYGCDHNFDLNIDEAMQSSRDAAQ